MAAKHSPGMWQAETWKYPTREHGPKSELVITNSEFRLAVLDSADEGSDSAGLSVDRETAKANQLLMVAAPQLLAALEMAYDRTRLGLALWSDDLQQMAEAISMAKTGSMCSEEESEDH